MFWDLASTPERGIRPCIVMIQYLGICLVDHNWQLDPKLKESWMRRDRYKCKSMKCKLIVIVCQDWASGWKAFRWELRGRIMVVIGFSPSLPQVVSSPVCHLLHFSPLNFSVSKEKLFSPPFSSAFFSKDPIWLHFSSPKISFSPSPSQVLQQILKRAIQYPVSSPITFTRWPA